LTFPASAVGRFHCVEAFTTTPFAVAETTYWQGAAHSPALRRFAFLRNRFRGAMPGEPHSTYPEHAARRRVIRNVWKRRTFFGPPPRSPIPYGGRGYYPTHSFAFLVHCLCAFSLHSPLHSICITSCIPAPPLHLSTSPPLHLSSSPHLLISTSPPLHLPASSVSRCEHPLPSRCVQPRATDST